MILGTSARARHRRACTHTSISSCGGGRAIRIGNSADSPGSEGRLQPRAATYAAGRRSRGRLPGNRPQHRRLLQPLHNDLDPYAVAYAIGSLLNNLFGKSKEPFWQQAYADLLKFVISLRRITDGYTTLAEVYRYIIEDELIRKNLRALKNHFDHPPDVIAIGPEVPGSDPTDAVDVLCAARRDARGTSLRGELDAYLASHDLPFEVSTGSHAICADRLHRRGQIYEFALFY
jgi:hypothetical protein